MNKKLFLGLAVIGFFGVCAADNEGLLELQKKIEAVSKAIEKQTTSINALIKEVQDSSVALAKINPNDLKTMDIDTLEMDGVSISLVEHKFLPKK